MIRLINKQMVLCNEMPLQGQETLKDLLMLGWRLKALINTHSVRNIGKTTELIKLAKEYGFTVVVGNSNVVDYLKHTYNYDNIYSQNNMTLRKRCKILVDETVNVNKLLKDMECDIVTGFYNESANKTGINDSSNFKEDTIKTLKEEAETINKIRKNALNNYNHSDYKLLINNFKQVVELINELEGKDKVQQINVNWDGCKVDRNEVEKFIDDFLNNN